MTVSSLDHILALRAMDLRIDEERDRRYAEVALEREKALKIKETADAEALELARQIQTYKDERANELRSQIERERGEYMTKEEHAIFAGEMANQFRPLHEFVAGQAGIHQLQGDQRQERHTAAGVRSALWALTGVVVMLVTLAVTIALATHGFK